MKKMVFKGGCKNVPLIGGMKAVNCGAHFEVDGEMFEAMSPEFSTHPTKIVSKYIKLPGATKVEISGWYNNNDTSNEMSFGIAYYYNIFDIQSYRYTQKIAKKWSSHLEDIKNAYTQIFGEE